VIADPGDRVFPWAPVEGQDAAELHPLPVPPPPPLRLVLEVEVMVTPLEAGVDPLRVVALTSQRLREGVDRELAAVRAAGPSVRVEAGFSHGRITDASGDEELSSW